MEKLWLKREIPDQNIIDNLKKALNIGDALAILLAQRGIVDFDSAKSYFRPDWGQLHDPFLMKDMDRAVDRIAKAIENKEPILIYGDYDVDGTTSVSMMYLFLKKHHHQLSYYIPDRYKEGYGVSKEGIDFAKANNIQLIISLDCGVKSVDLIQYALDAGIDFIVCDHHEPGEVLPSALAVLDPKRKDCAYPYKELSGCGVGFKLAQALSAKMNWPESDLKELLDFVCVSIACDIVQMDGENRALSYLGLQRLNEDPHPGLGVLLKKAFEKNPRSYYDINDIVFYAGPRINAAGRIHHAHGAVDLLIESDEDKAWKYASTLDTTNESRRSIEQEISSEAEALLEEDASFKELKSTVAYAPHWSKGVIGIVASRLVEKYYRPTIVLTKSEGKLAGSARSVGDFDIYSAIEACEEYLIQYGGHTHAAGLTMKEENLEKFREAFERVVVERIKESDEKPTLTYDLQIPLEQITDNFVSKLLQMNPFGPGNMNPVFLTRGVRDSGMAKAYGDHLSMNLWKGNEILGAMAFFKASYLNEVLQGKLFDICYHIDRTEFNGKQRLQLRILDMKPTAQ